MRRWQGQNHFVRKLRIQFYQLLFHGPDFEYTIFVAELIDSWYLPFTLCSSIKFHCRVNFKSQMAIAFKDILWSNKSSWLVLYEDSALLFRCTNKKRPHAQCILHIASTNEVFHHIQDQFSQGRGGRRASFAHVWIRIKPWHLSKLLSFLRYYFNLRSNWNCNKGRDSNII